MEDNRKSISLTEGPLFGRLVRFILPLFLMNLLQTLYNAADMIVVGLSGVEGAIGAIGTVTPFAHFFINSCMGFSMGGNVIVARCIGARDEKGVQTSLHTSVTISGIFGIVFSAAGLVLCRPVLIMLGDEGVILELAVRYCRYYFCCMPFLSLTNCFMAVFRAKGDTRTPLFVMTGAGLVNVALNLFFVLVCGRDVDGVALATTISNVVSAGVLGLMLVWDSGWCHLNPKKLGISPRPLREILGVGIPSALQGCVFSISNMLIMSSITGLNNTLFPGGSAIIDGNAAAVSIEGFAQSANQACHQATVTFISQHLGAGLYGRLRRVRARCLETAAALCVLVTGTILLLREPLIGLYVSDADAAAAAATRLVIMCSAYVIAILMDCESGVLRGLGHSAQSTVNTVFGCCGLRVIWILLLFPHVRELWFVYLSYPVTWTITMLMSHFAGEGYIRKLLEKSKTANKCS